MIDVEKIYLPRQKGGRGLINIKMCVKLKENNPAFYVKNQHSHLYAIEVILIAVGGKVGTYRSGGL